MSEIQMPKRSINITIALMAFSGLLIIYVETMIVPFITFTPTVTLIVYIVSRAPPKAGAIDIPISLNTVFIPVASPAFSLGVEVRSTFIMPTSIMEIPDPTNIVSKRISGIVALYE